MNRAQMIDWAVPPGRESSKAFCRTKQFTRRSMIIAMPTMPTKIGGRSNGGYFNRMGEATVIPSVIPFVAYISVRLRAFAV
jgi:hypothetical protein